MGPFVVVTPHPLKELIRFKDVLVYVHLHF